MGLVKIGLSAMQIFRHSTIAWNLFFELQAAKKGLRSFPMGTLFRMNRLIARRQDALLLPRRRKIFQLQKSAARWAKVHLPVPSICFCPTLWLLAI